MVGPANKEKKDETDNKRRTFKKIGTRTAGPFRHGFKSPGPDGTRHSRTAQRPRQSGKYKPDAERDAGDVTHGKAGALAPAPAAGLRLDRAVLPRFIGIGAQGPGGVGGSISGGIFSGL